MKEMRGSVEGRCYFWRFSLPLRPRGLLNVKWTVVRKDFSNMKNDNNLYYWEACSVSSPRKLRKKVVGCLPPNGILKFNVDDATGGKPGPAGVGGVF